MAFTKIAFDDGLYELSWKPPVKGDDDITNYTIFWCDHDRDRPYQCQVSAAVYIIPFLREILIGAVRENTYELRSIISIVAVAFFNQDKVPGTLLVLGIELVRRNLFFFQKQLAHTEYSSSFFSLSVTFISAYFWILRIDLSSQYLTQHLKKVLCAKIAVMEFNKKV